MIGLTKRRIMNIWIGLACHSQYLRAPVWFVTSMDRQGLGSTDPTVRFFAALAMTSLGAGSLVNLLWYLDHNHQLRPRDALQLFGSLTSNNSNFEGDDSINGNFF